MSFERMTFVFKAPENMEQSERRDAKAKRIIQLYEDGCLTWEEIAYILMQVQCGYYD